jgi:class 3 adenylate cyclase
MAAWFADSFPPADDVEQVGGVRSASLTIGDMIVAQTTHPPGWRWSTHVQTIVGTDRCQVRHLGYVVSGRAGFELAGGELREVAAGMVYDVPPGHDVWTIGDEPFVTLEWSGGREWLQPAHGERVLATLLFTDIVDSTAIAARLGDRAWRARLEGHDEVVRQALRETRGAEIKTTGDGFLARFDGPAHAIECAIRIRDRVHGLALEVRQGIHVGEVELRGADVAGLAVHEAARIAGVAGAGEVVVSAITRSLAAGTRFAFASLGARPMKGLGAPVEVFAVTGT